MFDWKLFLVLVLVCVPGVLVVLPGMLSTVEVTARKGLPEGKKLPRREVMLANMGGWALASIALAAAGGTALAPRVGFGAPFLEALISGEPAWPALRPQLLPALGLSVAGTLILLAAYYGFFRRRLDAETIDAIEGSRNKLGIWGRVLYHLALGHPLWPGPRAKFHRRRCQADADAIRVDDLSQPVGGHDLCLALLAVWTRSGDDRPRAVPPGVVAGGCEDGPECASPHPPGGGIWENRLIGWNGEIRRQARGDER
jgi:hypothetical protein